MTSQPCLECVCFYSCLCLSFEFQKHFIMHSAESKSKKRNYKWCFVPDCPSTNKRNPEKIFITVPKNGETRKKWFRAAGREDVPTYAMYCCEDHFNVTEDIENYLRFEMMDRSVKIRLKVGIVPHIFSCQRSNTGSTLSENYSEKDNKEILSLKNLKECEKNENSCNEIPEAGTMNAALERKVIKEFIEVYHSEPCLWQFRSVHYNNRTKKSQAYSRMVAKLREIYPDADLEAVKRKINALRTNYRKEQKKVLASKERSQLTGEPVYVPSLWYYDLFEFIGDQDNWPSPLNDMDPLNAEDGDMVDFEEPDANFDGEDYGEMYDDDFLSESPKQSPQTPNHINNDSATYETSYQNHQPRRVSYKRPHDYYRTDQTHDFRSELMMYNKNGQLPEKRLYSCDAEESFGQYVASKLKKMNTENQILAEKLISEIVYMGQLNMLTQSTTIELNVKQEVKEVEDSKEDADELVIDLNKLV